jgi:MFS family permease
MHSENERPAGYRGTVAALAVGQLFGWGALFYAFSVFVLPMHAELGWGKPAIMGAFTLGLATWGVVSYAAGAAIDRGHDRLVMSLGAAAAGLGFIAWSQVQSLWQLYAAWLVMGAAMATCLYEPAFSVVTRRFPLRYQQAITALTLVGGFASTVCFPAVTWLIGAWGWRWALAVIGLVLLCGVAPLHAWALRRLVQPAPPVLTRADDEAEDDATLHEALRHRHFWLLTLSFTLYAFVSAALWAHVMPALASKGLSEAAALAVVTWVGPAQVLGRVMWLVVGRWVDQRTLGLTVLASFPAALAIFALGERLPVLIAFALLFGVVNGLVTIVRGNVVPEYFGREHVGRISGAMSAIALVSRAAAPLGTAGLLLVLPGYREALLVLCLLGVGTWLSYAAARR